MYIYIWQFFFVLLFHSLNSFNRHHSPFPPEQVVPIPTCQRSEEISNDDNDDDDDVAAVAMFVVTVIAVIVIVMVIVIVIVIVNIVIVPIVVAECSLEQSRAIAQQLVQCCDSGERAQT
jgi:hypothetical protein